MAKILINDGLHKKGIDILLQAGHEVTNQKYDQDELFKELPKYDVICIRSATKVRKNLIEKCPNLKIIARGGVGLDNVDLEFAKTKGIDVINTPAASSRSVAELTMAHIFSLARFLYQSNRMMPEDGDNNFKGLKKAYSKGIELEGKTIGIIGIGRIGQETARLAIGIGMSVLAVDPYVDQTAVPVGYGYFNKKVEVKTIPMEDMLPKADFIVIHTPSTGKAILGAEEFSKMKSGVFIVNCARGGTVDEDALLDALDNGNVEAAGLDVFENEPNPRMDLLQHPRVCLTPHIGASTIEAQQKIAIELANKINELLG